MWTLLTIIGTEVMCLNDSRPKFVQGPGWPSGLGGWFKLTTSTEHCSLFTFQAWVHAWLCTLPKGCDQLE